MPKEFYRRSALLLTCALLVSLSGLAAILPEQFGDFKRSKATPLKAPDPKLYEEFGLEEAEHADFAVGSAKFGIDAWRMRDSTDALALYEARRPENSPASPLAKLAAKTPTGVLLVYGNYVLEFSGKTPEAADVEALGKKLPQVEMAPLPSLIGFLPPADLIPGSERYIVGPVSLERFEPQLSPSLVAFHLGAEAQSALYKTSAGTMKLLVFNYPTPDMARERQDAFLQQPGVLAKRSGPLVAVLIHPPDPDAAQRLLALVQYQAKVTWSDTVKRNEASRLANLILTGFLLAGLLGGASLLVGLWLGGFRAISKKLGWHQEPEALTVLRIGYDPPPDARDK